MLSGLAAVSHNKGGKSQANLIPSNVMAKRYRAGFLRPGSIEIRFSQNSFSSPEKPQEISKAAEKVVRHGQYLTAVVPRPLQQMII